MGKPAIGNKPPKRLRITLVAASALAAYLVKASTMYICVGTWCDRRQSFCGSKAVTVFLLLTNEKISPAPVKPVKMIGTIQCILYCTVQP